MIAYYVVGSSRFQNQIMCAKQFFSSYTSDTSQYLVVNFLIYFITLQQQVRFWHFWETCLLIELYNFSKGHCCVGLYSNKYRIFNNHFRHLHQSDFQGVKVLKKKKHHYIKNGFDNLLLDVTVNKNQPVGGVCA